VRKNETEKKRVDKRLFEPKSIEEMAEAMGIRLR